MTIVSSKEFVTNEDVYFDLAMTEQVFVQRDNITFVITRANSTEKNYLEPDDDLRRAITGEELLTGIYEDLEKFFADK
jgi:hypothetical protein